MNNKENKFLGIWVFGVIFLLGVFLVGGLSSRGTLASTDTSSSVIKETYYKCSNGGTYDGLTGKCPNGGTAEIDYYLLDINLVDISEGNNEIYGSCKTLSGEKRCYVDLSFNV